MSEPIRVLGISGSLRVHSFNSGLLRAAMAAAPEGLFIEPWRIEQIPMFNQDEEGKPPESVHQFREKILAADGILFATPEYNYSVPGVLKNAIDWASRPASSNAWNGKPAAVMGAGGLSGTIRAQLHLRQIAIYANLFVMNRPEVIVQRAREKFDAQGELIDEPTREQVKKFLVAFRDWIIRLKK